MTLVFAVNHVIRSISVVGWVIRPVKTVGRVTCIVLVQTLYHAQSINQDYFRHDVVTICMLKIA